MFVSVCNDCICNLATTQLLGKYSRLSMFRNRRSHECTCPRRHHTAVLRGYSVLIDCFRSFVSDVFDFSGKFSTTGKPLYANFHLREDECVTKIEDETPINAKKPSPSDVSWDLSLIHI